MKNKPNKGILAVMRFPPRPPESKNHIRRAGHIMLDKSLSVEERAAAIDLVDRFRASHAYPINTFQSTLHDKLEDFPNSFMAQRLKRMPAIVRKLRKERSMQVTTMQDIGGLRAVVSSVKEAYRLEREYSSARFEHILKSAVSYIALPRASGYRSLHLIYEYVNKKNTSYNGLLLELQIRTAIQHSWATAVETMETIIHQPLKSSRGSKEWLDFFAITASAFAHLEGTHPVPGYSHLSKEETFKLVKEAEAKLNVRAVMETLPLVVSQVAAQPQASQYHLIIQDFDAKKVMVRSYSRISIEQATKDYAEYEAQALKDGKRMNVVLVSAIDLQKAYPNLFLQAQDFIKNLNKVILAV